MTAVPVPALVAAITDVLAAELRDLDVICPMWDRDYEAGDPPCAKHQAEIDRLVTRLASPVAATVVGLLPGLPPEDVAALFASRGAFITGGDSVYVPGLDRLPAPAEPERGA